jgi:hypothetical protein
MGMQKGCGSPFEVGLDYSHLPNFTEHGIAVGSSREVGIMKGIVRNLRVYSEVAECELMGYFIRYGIYCTNTDILLMRGFITVANDAVDPDSESRICKLFDDWFLSLDNPTDLLVNRSMTRQERIKQYYLGSKPAICSIANYSQEYFDELVMFAEEISVATCKVFETYFQNGPNDGKE